MSGILYGTPHDGTLHFDIPESESPGVGYYRNVLENFVIPQLPKFRFAVREGLDSSFLPTKSEPFATGWDVRCAEGGGVLLSFEPKLIRLGFRMYAPEGYWLELRPRSSTFAKKGLHCLYGVIDEHYPNELMLAVQFIPQRNYSVSGVMTETTSVHIPFGEKIAQVIPIKRREMVVEGISNEQIDELYQTRNSVRTGGFGSTG